MLDDLVPLVAVSAIFIGMPWLLLHYVTKWKQSPTLTGEDENLLDELHVTARRLEERLHVIERIVAADHPDFRPDFRSGPHPEARSTAPGTSSTPGAAPVGEPPRSN